jgi:hypothetical protein
VERGEVAHASDPPPSPASPRLRAEPAISRRGAEAPRGIEECCRWKCSWTPLTVPGDGALVDAATARLVPGGSLFRVGLLRVPAPLRENPLVPVSAQGCTPSHDLPPSPASSRLSEDGLPGAPAFGTVGGGNYPITQLPNLCNC